MLIQLFCFLTTVSTCLSLRCLECTHALSPAECNLATQCADNSYCFVDQVVTQGGAAAYNLGCRSIQGCATNKRDDLKLCQDCCNSTDFCNNQGCGKTVPAPDQRGPYCFDCDRQTDGTSCRTITECSINTSCALLRTLDKVYNEYRYTSRCMSSTQCRALQIFGRRAASSNVKCCNTDYCNHD